jgi:hypothetical protein
VLGGTAELQQLEDFFAALEDNSAAAAPCARSSDGSIGVSWWPVVTGSTDQAPPSTLRFSLLSSSPSEYVAVGFNGNGGMVGADMVIAHVRPRNQSAPACSGLDACLVTLLDASSSGYSTPTADAVQDVTIVSAERSPGGVRVVFDRPVTTGSANDKSLSAAQYLLFARGPATVGSGASLSLGFHTHASHTAATVVLASTALECLQSNWAAMVAALDPSGGDNSGSGSGIVAPSIDERAAKETAIIRHAALMIIGWWLLMTTGGFLSRYRAFLFGVPSKTVPGPPSTNGTVPPGSGASNNEGTTNSVPWGEVSKINFHTNESGRRLTGVSVHSGASSSTGESTASVSKGAAAWFYAHVFSVIGGAILVLAGFAIIVIQEHFETGNWTTHQRSGFAAVVLLCAQVLIGIVRPNPWSRFRTYWLWAHRTAALAAFVAAFTAIPTGLKLIQLWDARVHALIALHALSCVGVIALGEITRSGESDSSQIPTSSKAAVSAPKQGSADATGRLATSLSASSISQGARVARLGLTVAPLVAVSAVLVALVVRFDFKGRQYALGDVGGAGTSSLQGGDPAVQEEPTLTSAGIINGGSTEETVNMCMHFYKYQIPSQRTSYMCRGFAFPPNTTLHTIEFVPMVDNAPFVHHMILYGGSSDLSTRGDARGVFDCSDMPDTTGPIWIWAVGSSALVMPEGVGMKMPSWGILQVHYDNPNGLVGQMDNSGVLMKVTKNLRPMTSGLFMFGPPISRLSLPSGRRTGFQNTCGPSMTNLLRYQVADPMNPALKVFAVALHMHTLGREIWTEQWRNGVRLTVNGTDSLGHLSNYDFNMQTITPVDPTRVTILPGDSIVTRCIFENTYQAGVLGNNPEAMANRTVTGGESTSQEMCLNFVYYYPALQQYPFLPCDVINAGSTSVFCGSASTPNCDTFH